MASLKRNNLSRSWKETGWKWSSSLACSSPRSTRGRPRIAPGIHLLGPWGKGKVKHRKAGVVWAELSDEALHYPRSSVRLLYTAEREGGWGRYIRINKKARCTLWSRIEEAPLANLLGAAFVGEHSSSHVYALVGESYSGHFLARLSPSTQEPEEGSAFPRSHTPRVR